MPNDQDTSRVEIHDQSIEFLLYLYKQRSSKSTEQKSDLNHQNTESVPSINSGFELVTNPGSSTPCYAAKNIFSVNLSPSLPLKGSIALCQVDCTLEKELSGM